MHIVWAALLVLLVIVIVGKIFIMIKDPHGERRD
jgi:hypothetical protein